MGSLTNTAAANDRFGTLLYGFGYVKVTVCLCALYGYEQVAGYHFS